MFFDPIYILFALPALALSIYATVLTRSRFARYSEVQPYSGMTGAEAARTLLDRQGLQSVAVEEVEGFLSDHYDPSTRTLRLSPDVYRSSSLAAVGVACHEAGHAATRKRHGVPGACRERGRRWSPAGVVERQEILRRDRSRLSKSSIP